MRNDLTDATVVLDRSGSMQSCRDDAEGGLNTFVGAQLFSLCGRIRMLKHSTSSRASAVCSSVIVLILLCHGGHLIAADEPASAKVEVENSAAASKKNGLDDNSQKTASPKDAKEAKDKQPPKKPQLVNLNTATEAKLITLPGITRPYAKRIIAGRPYESVDDLKKAGVPVATIGKLRARATVNDDAVEYTAAKPTAEDESPHLVDLNTATEAQLRQELDISEMYAKKVIAGRPYKSVDDLSKAGLPAAAVAKMKPLVTVGSKTAAPAKGLVWVNRLSKKYHKEGSQWYGKTKDGQYMTEAEALKAGYVAAKRQ